MITTKHVACFALDIEKVNEHLPSRHVSGLKPALHPKGHVPWVLLHTRSFLQEPQVIAQL